MNFFTDICGLRIKVGYYIPFTPVFSEVQCIFEVITLVNLGSDQSNYFENALHGYPWKVNIDEVPQVPWEKYCLCDMSD